LYNGRIWVESKVAQGLRIMVRFEKTNLLSRDVYSNKYMEIVRVA